VTGRGLDSKLQDLYVFKRLEHIQANKTEARFLQIPRMVEFWRHKDHEAFPPTENDSITEAHVQEEADEADESNEDDENDEDDLEVVPLEDVSDNEKSDDGDLNSLIEEDEEQRENERE